MKVTQNIELSDKVFNYLVQASQQEMAFTLLKDIFALIALIALFGYPSYRVTKALLKSIKNRNFGDVFAIQLLLVLTFLLIVFIEACYFFEIVQILVFPKVFILNQLKALF